MQGAMGIFSFKQRSAKEWLLGSYDYGYLCKPEWPFKKAKREPPQFYGELAVHSRSKVRGAPACVVVYARGRALNGGAACMTSGRRSAWLSGLSPAPPAAHSLAPLPVEVYLTCALNCSGVCRGECLAGPSYCDHHGSAARPVHDWR